MSAMDSLTSERPQPTRAFAWLALLGLACMMLFGIGIALGIDGDEITVHGLAIMITFLGLVPLVLDQGRVAQQRHLLLTLTSLVYVVYLAVPVWTLYFLSGRQIFLEEVLLIRAPEITAGLIAALIGQIFLLAGYAMPFGRLFMSVVPKPTRDWSPEISIGIALVMIPLGIAVWLGSVMGIIPTRLGSGVLGTVSQGTFYGVALLTIVYLRYRTRLVLVILPVVVPLIMTLYFFSGMKESFFMAPAFFILALLVTRRRIPARWVITGIVAFVLFYPISAAFRATAWQTQNLQQSLQSPVQTITKTIRETSGYRVREYITDGLVATASRTSSLPWLSVIVHDTPSRVPYQEGWTLSYAVLAFIPRVIWTGKPVFDTGQFITNTYGAGVDTRSSTAISLVGDFYLNFGYPGIVLGMLFMGFFIRLTHELLFTVEPTIPVLFAAAIACYIIPRNIENFFSAISSGLIFALAPIVVVHFLVRSTRRSSTVVAPEDGEDFIGRRLEI